MRFVKRLANSKLTYVPNIKSHMSYHIYIYNGVMQFVGREKKIDVHFFFFWEKLVVYATKSRREMRLKESKNKNDHFVSICLL